MRGGRIPGAVHFPGVRNLDPDIHRFLSPDLLRAQAMEAGLRPENRVITYCGAGMVASTGLLALHLAGYRDLALYDASWDEWGTDPASPLEHDRPAG